MSIKTKIIGGESGLTEAHVHIGKEPYHNLHPGLITYTHNLEKRNFDTRFFTNDTYGADQNVTSIVPAASTIVHNGGDTVAFSAANLVGTGFVFNSTTVFRTGTASIDATATVNGDIASLTNGSQPISTYDSLDGYIYITSWPANGNKDLTFQLYSAGAPVGVVLGLSVYVDENSQDLWQLFSIPMTDFLSQTPNFDEIRITSVATGPGTPISLYLDDIELVAAGQSRNTVYSVCPAPSEVMEVRKIKWVAAVTKLKVEYDEFFGIPQLPNGYTLSFKTRGLVTSQFFAKDFYDMLQFPNISLQTWEGQTETIYQLILDIPEEQSVLVGQLDQCMELTVRDDLSSLIRFRASVQGALISQW